MAATGEHEAQPASSFMFDEVGESQQGHLDIEDALRQVMDGIYEIIRRLMLLEERW